jgi:hypothetical protein
MGGRCRDRHRTAARPRAAQVACGFTLAGLILLAGILAVLLASVGRAGGAR